MNKEQLKLKIALAAKEYAEENANSEEEKQILFKSVIREGIDHVLNKKGGMVMQSIELNKDIKKLLKAHDVPADVIDLVEDYHISTVKGVAEELTKQTEEKEKSTKKAKRDFRSDVRNIANEARIIK
ncbi:MAG TPA: hypothetical protein VK111_08880 [Virgibacillus sp.]|nr:hypothetical protein [Virgibacillus sp.]